MAIAVEELAGIKDYWPKEPYKGLNFYSAQDAPLFCERDQDISVCGQLITSATTKILLLHGRTGTGKSSFLRAGLFANVLRNRPTFYLPHENGEPCFIRSTDDPLASVSDMLAQKLPLDTHFPGVATETRQRAVADLKSRFNASPKERESALRRVLESITRELNGILVLVIDQAEEIFTLDPRSNTEVKAAYFGFLERLCFDRFGIKIVLALRTEYYGQFADNFRVAPALRISTVVSGLDQFMLQGVQDVDRLCTAIQRPTVERVIAGNIPPVCKYLFAYAPGLAFEIAQDVLKHCGESSALPVMQIVCADIYENLPELNETQRKIRDQAHRDQAHADPGSVEGGIDTLVSLARRNVRWVRHRDYSDRNAVEGAIDRFIENAISSALKNCGLSSPRRRLIDGWKHIVSSLVARQEGGALTSLLLTHDQLLEKAREANIHPPIGPCLEFLAREKPRLLRSIALRSQATGGVVTHYSLGHDALAPSLFQWREKHGRLIEERAEARRRIMVIVGVSAIIAALVFLGGLFAASWTAMRSEEAALHASIRTTASEPEISDRILLLAALERNMGTPWRVLLRTTANEVDQRLRERLITAPVLSATAVAAGVSETGDRIALVRPDGSVVLRLLRPWSPQSAVLYPAPISNRFDAVVGVGFVKGLTTPVVVTNKDIYYGVGQRASADEFVADRDFGATSLEFTGGLLQLSAYYFSRNIVVVYQLAYDQTNLRFKVTNTFKHPNDLRYQNRIYSHEAPIVAYTEGDDPEGAPGKPIRLLAAPLTSPSDGYLVAEELPPTQGSRYGLRPWALTFLPDGDTLAYRDSLRRITFVTQVAQPMRPPPVSYTVAPSVSSDEMLEPGAPVSVTSPVSKLARPQLAAVHTERGYRVAWLTEQGISVLQSDSGNGLAVLPGAVSRSNLLILGLGARDIFTDIRFDSSGDLLVFTAHDESRSLVRVWDLSDKRYAALTEMSWDALIAEACRVGADTKDGATGIELSKEDFDKLPVSSQIQPCSKVN